MAVPISRPILNWLDNFGTLGALGFRGHTETSRLELRSSLDLGLKRLRGHLNYGVPDFN